MRIANYLLLGAAALTANVYADEKPVLSVILPTGADFDSVYSGLNRELGEDYNLKTFRFEAGSNVDATAKSILASNPKGIVALDNTTLEVVKSVQKDPSAQEIPVFAGAMLQVKQEVDSKGIKNACGVQFEVPAFTQFSNLKQVSVSKFLKVGVIYRREFQPMIDVSKEQLRKDNIELKQYCIDCDGKTLDEKSTVKGLKEIWKNLESEPELAVWVLADNGLLTSKTMGEFWLDKVAKVKKPVVSPLEMFVTGQKPFGEMALLALSPDFVELGSQLAGTIQSVIEDGEVASEKGFEPLVSVKKYLNKKKSDKINWELNPENMGQIDRVY